MPIISSFIDRIYYDENSIDKIKNKYDTHEISNSDLVDKVYNKFLDDCKEFNETFSKSNLSKYYKEIKSLVDSDNTKKSNNLRIIYFQNMIRNTMYSLIKDKYSFLKDIFTSNIYDFNIFINESHALMFDTEKIKIDNLQYTPKEFMKYYKKSILNIIDIKELADFFCNIVPTIYFNNSYISALYSSFIRVSNQSAYIANNKYNEDSTNKYYYFIEHILNGRIGINNIFVSMIYNMYNYDPKILIYFLRNIINFGNRSDKKSTDILIKTAIIIVDILHNNPDEKSLRNYIKEDIIDTSNNESRSNLEEVNNCLRINIEKYFQYKENFSRSNSVITENVLRSTLHDYKSYNNIVYSNIKTEPINLANFINMTYNEYLNSNDDTVIYEICKKNYFNAEMYHGNFTIPTLISNSSKIYFANIDSKFIDMIISNFVYIHYKYSLLENYDELEALYNNAISVYNSNINNDNLIGHNYNITDINSYNKEFNTLIMKIYMRKL
ncbi:hypothetical protein FPHOBKDP_00043 [Listeria phage LPJP1]|nr:hypothetical protein FPHOBKDP_00043 [Listeria phage LPJP1]